MGVTAEGSGGDVTSGRANESTSNFCGQLIQIFSYSFQLGLE
jgi:hypothetical protein